MKKYGIYLAYPPTADLRTEGLGRHLAEFLKVAFERKDIGFVIACPSWMQESLRELFEAHGLRIQDFEIIAPPRKPVLLRMYERYRIFKKRPKKEGKFKRYTHYLKITLFKIFSYGEQKIITSRGFEVYIVLGLLILPFLFVAFIVKLLKGILKLLGRLIHTLWAKLTKYLTIHHWLNWINSLTLQPKTDVRVVRWYRLMMEAEVSLMHDLISARKDIAAWYSPTAFWPHFNKLSTPKLVCVPDVVLADFPVGFATVGGERRLDSFKQVEKAIESGQYFVTYSETIKWETLIKRYHIDPTVISVIRHGTQRLDEYISISGFSDNDAATHSLCKHLFKFTLNKAINFPYAYNFDSGDVKFIFYASQFRPNKNIISLLRAYEYLLKRCYMGYKLILTGNPDTLPDIAKFISDHHLENDVLCLHGLSIQELAACYHLADLAVNPSLSEGGCPFTFTEALSVGTPVVMSRIAVTEEVITDPHLQEMMLFDPYDWKNMADKIEWALKNQQFLLDKQKPFYDQLAKRTWRQVVDEHIEILDRISGEAHV